LVRVGFVLDEVDARALNCAQPVKVPGAFELQCRSKFLPFELLDGLRSILLARLTEVDVLDAYSTIMFADSGRANCNRGAVEPCTLLA
jgi:hypothetical protein